MKILHFVHGWFPRHTGGTEQYVNALAREQLARGHTVAVVAGSERPKNKAQIERDGSGSYPVYRLHRSGLFLESWYQGSNPEVEELVAQLLRDLGPDVIHVHHWRRLSNRLVEVAAKLGVPSLVTLHDTATTCAKILRVRNDAFCLREPIAENCRNCVDRFWFQDDREIDSQVELYRQDFARELNLATAIVAPSLSLAEVVEKHQSVEERKIEILPHPRLYPRQPAPETKARSKDRLHLAYWGSLQPVKGVHILLEAMKRTMAPSSFSLDLWGPLNEVDEAYVDRLHELAQGLDVQFRGSFEPRDIPVDYDLAVFPSIALESYSFTVDEALERRIPVLVPDRGAPEERLGNPEATFKAEDASHLAMRLQQALDQPAYLENLRSKIPDLPDLSIHVDEIMDIYRWCQDEFIVPQRDDHAGESARAQHMQEVIRARDERLFSLQGRADGDSEKAKFLESEVRVREQVIERKDVVLDEFNLNLGALTKTLEKRDRELEKVRNQVVEAQAFQSYRRDESQETISEQSRQLEEYRRSTNELLAARQDLTEQIQLIESDRTQVRLELDSLRVAHQEAMQRLENARKQLRVASNERGEEVKSLSASLQELKTQVDSGAQKILEEEESRLHLEALVRKLRRDKIQASEAMAQKVAELEASDSGFSKSREEVSRLKDSLAQLEANQEESVASLEELEQVNHRLRGLRDNLLSEIESQSNITNLTRDALTKALAEVQRLDRVVADVHSGIGDRLRPIAAEVASHDIGQADLDTILDLVLGNHGRLHQLIGERDEVLTELILRVDEYENQNPAKSGQVSGQTPGDLTRRLKSRVRGLSKRLKPKRSSGKKRLLFVVHDFLPKHNAGTEIYTYNLARGLQAEYDVHLLFCEARHELPRYTVNQGNFNGLPFTEVVHNYEWENFEETYHDPRMEEIFREVLDDFNPDLVHFQHLHYFSFNFIPIAKERGLPVVYTLHEFMLMCARGGQLLREDMEICEFPVPEKCADCIRGSKLAGDYGQKSTKRAADRVADLLPDNLKRAFEGYAGPRIPAELDEDGRRVYAAAAARRLDFIQERITDVDLFISPSGFLRQKFIDSGMIRADQIVHSDNGFDITPFANFQHKPSEILRFGFVGTIAEYKGVHILMEAMNDIVADNVELQIWGDIETFAEYKEQLTPLLRNPAIKLKGRFDNNRIAEVMAEIDVLIVPSLWFENSPLTIHEAWLAHIPLVVSDRGGMAELVQDGVGGFHFKLGDAEDLRRKLMRFVQDPSLVRKLGDHPGVVKPIAENVVEMTGRYQKLLQGVRR